MIDALLAFLADFSQQPLWVQIWVNFLGIVNFAAIFYLRQSKLAAIVLVAIILAAIGLIYLHSQYGYVRLLGLPHIVLWTPMLVYFWKEMPKLAPSRLLTYLRVLTTTNFISLLFDYVDVARYFLGMG